jgi:hypothetical protein
MILRNNPILIIASLISFILLAPSDASAIFRRQAPPSWVNTQLSDPNYFIGIGSAPIIKKQNTHIERARRDALNELASEISVQIFSSNVLVTLVKDDKITDEYNSLIRSRVTTELDGYELYDSYADKKTYWVYYRLSKQHYYEQQHKKRQAAIQQALSFYSTAREAEQRGDKKSAIVNFARSLDAVKLHLSENLSATLNGKEENLVAQVVAALNHNLSGLKIEAIAPQINTVLSEEIKQDQLTFFLKDAAGNPVGGFPLQGYYSERAIQQPKVITDHQGKAQFSIGKVRSSRQQEEIRITADINAILLETSADFVVRRTLIEMPAPSLTLPVYIRKPSIRFVIAEKHNNEKMTEEVLERTFRNLSQRSGYPVGLTGHADYICYVETNTRQLSYNNGIYTYELQGNMVLTDQYDNIRYTTQLTPLRGVQLSPEKAGMEAYKLLQQHISTRYFREIEEAILR